MKVLLVFIICILIAFSHQNATANSEALNVGTTLGYPWMVAITVTRTGSTVFCGGALIHVNHVITAAQCVAGDVQQLSLNFGGITLAPVEAGRVTVLITNPAESIIIHESYNPITFNFDLALIRMRNPITTNNRIGLVPLPPQQQELPPTTAVVMSGWGRENAQSNGLSNNLQLSFLTITPNLECENTFPGIRSNVFVCAVGSAAGRNVCHGDFGNPLVRFGPDGAQLVGIASFMYNNICGNVNPSAFTRVAPRVTWIQQWIRRI